MLAIIYYIQSSIMEKGEDKNVSIKHLQGGFYYAIYGSLHLIGLTLLATEIGVLIRRVSQIIAGFIIDKKTHTIIDIILILLMISGGIILIIL